MKKKNEVIEMLNAGGYILVDSIYRTAHVYDANGENGDTCRYDVAERLGRADGFEKIKHEGWHASWTVAKAAAENAAEAEKTAQEWTEESERVEAATLAALAPVIAAEEAAPAAEAAQEAEEAEPEYLEERWPESNKMPGIWYRLEWTKPGENYWNYTHADTVENLRYHIYQIRHKCGYITKATRHDENAGTIREFIPETSQEKTDRENQEHCKRIAEDLEAYAAGNVYRCPECGREHTWDQIEASEHEDECGWAVYTCPDCGEENREDAWEQLSLYDYFSDCLDIEYRCGSDREYRSAQIMVACGGPNIYIDTAEKAVLLYWWTDRARYYLSSDACEAVDDWAREYWECI